MLPNARRRAASGLRRWSWRTGTVSSLTGATTVPPGLRILHCPRWGGDAFWPGTGCQPRPHSGAGERRREAQTGLGPLTSERLGAPRITNRDDASPDAERFVTRRLRHPFVSLLERRESVFGGTWA